jgi:hypothetical protein
MRRLSALFTLLFCAGTLLAQNSTGSIFGKVTDPQKLAIPQATITIRSTDLATVRVVQSDAAGEFRINGLVPGAYTLDAHTKSLKLRKPAKLTVGLGSSVDIAIKLEITDVKQKTTVSARAGTSEGNTTAPPINQSEASVSTFFAGLTETYLPNRDRDVTQFDQFTADSHDNDDCTSVDGQRTNALITQVDDVAFSSPLFGSARTAEDHPFFLPQTVVREFQLVTAGASAEVGFTNAGFVNVATKEGSNRLHGEAFYTARPATLTSSDAFGNSPSNTMNNFGLSDGGPIVKNKLFFYAGIEQDILHAPRFTEFAPQAPTFATPTNLLALQGQINERDTPLAISGRLDAILSTRNTLNLEMAGTRVRSARMEDLSGDGEERTLGAASTAANESGQSLFAKVGLSSVLNATSVNRALVAWSSDHRAITPLSTAPAFIINGFGALGGSTLGPHLYTAQQWQIADDVTLSRGRSLLSVGGTFFYDPSYEQREENLNGRFDYSSLADFLNSAPRRFQQTFVTGNVRYNEAVKSLGLYATERIELHRGLTLTAGLRWAGQWNPQPLHANPLAAQSQHIPNDLTQWQPRVGLAWIANGRTVVRVSSGLYDAPTPAAIFHRVFADNGTQTVTADSYFDPALLTLTNAKTTVPVALGTVPSALTTPQSFVEAIDPRFLNPRSFQSAASVDETVNSRLIIRAEYLHASTWRLQRTVDENLNAPTINAQGMPVFPALRPILGIGREMVNQSSAHSHYDGLTLSALAKLSTRSQITVNYTLSRTKDGDTSDGPYSISSALNPYDLHAEDAYSNLDVRHVLNVAGIFNLPLGFKLNPLIVAQSGSPYSALVGFDTQNDANDFNDRAVVNGVVTPRNIYRGPVFGDGDVRVVKDFTLKGEGHHLDLFMDIFNVTGASNRNFGAQQVSLFGSPGNPLFSAGQALYAPGTTRIGGPRGFQFTARLVGF